MIIALVKLNITYLLLCLTFVELNSKYIISHQKDNTKYDNNVNKATGFLEKELYNRNSPYERFTTDVSLEQSIMPAEIIELTTPSIENNVINNMEPSLAKDFLMTELEDNFSSNTDISSTKPADNILDYNDLEHLFSKIEYDDDNSCFMDDIKLALLWWAFPNGTLKQPNLNTKSAIPNLDLSYRNISQDEELYQQIQNLDDNNKIVAFSAAYNNLTSVPQQTLGFIGNSLEYLTLKGNQFSSIQIQQQNLYNNVDCLENHAKKLRKINEAWAIFPYLPNLLELDISNCNIEYVTNLVFRNLTNLKRLYMSHNQILTMPFDTFLYTPALEYLDFSFNNVLEYNDKKTLSIMDSVINIMHGLDIHQLAFKYLPNLIYLDLSHTKLKRDSIMAFTHLGGHLKYLSLCGTAFPVIGNDIFKNTALEGLDLSGNTLAANNILEDAFKGISNTLKYLYFERSNINDISWLKYLHNLRFLGLAGNNINSLTIDMFSPLTSLQVVDLTSNQVGNWYNQAFFYNNNLRVLSLKDNNLNIITSEMIKDFSLLDYLSLGDNNFVCDCLLRELVDLAAVNNKNGKCKGNVLKDMQENINENMKTFGERAANITKSKWNTHMGQVNIASVLWKQHLNKLKSGTWKTKKLSISKMLKMRFPSDNPKQSSLSNTSSTETPTDKLNGTILKFQLIDYEEGHYWCFNETEKLKLIELNCQQQTYVGDIEEQLDTLTTYIIICISSLVGVALLGFIIYWKRWYIHYYYSSLKTASLMSLAAKKNSEQFNTLADHNPNMIYDIFISYCQTDREWILEELIPNVEETGDISICLHERDFQIGVTIIDNIVSCMERSRALMLIISSNFLLSHWCQFEMQLAQHMIFDVSKENMILVFLEDIPRSKRPKHLQYMMDIKTFIKWPGGKDKSVRLEDRKLFWKRLKRSLVNMGLNPTESKA